MKIKTNHVPKGCDYLAVDIKYEERVKKLTKVVIDLERHNGTLKALLLTVSIALIVSLVHIF